MSEPPLRGTGQPVTRGTWLGPTESRWILPIARLRRVAHMHE
jgi:hypothetical protein